MPGAKSLGPWQQSALGIFTDGRPGLAQGIFQVAASPVFR